MNKNDLIELNYLKDFKKDKINHIQRLNERINELIRFKEIIENDLKNINKKFKYIIIKNFDFNKYDKNLFIVNQIGELKNNYKNYKNYYIIINE